MIFLTLFFLVKYRISRPSKDTAKPRSAQHDIIAFIKPVSVLFQAVVLCHDVGTQKVITQEQHTVAFWRLLTLARLHLMLLRFYSM